MFKVMVVDDEYLVRSGLVDSVPWKENGFRVVGEAENGEEALEKINSLKPDILLTDIRMPVMDGIELIRRIRKQGLGTGIIILTCYDEFKYAQQAIKYNVDDYILKLSSKPCDILSVCEKVGKKLALRSATGKSEKEFREYDKNILCCGNCFIEGYFIYLAENRYMSDGKQMDYRKVNPVLARCLSEFFDVNTYHIFTCPPRGYLLYVAQLPGSGTGQVCQKLLEYINTMAGHAFSFGISLKCMEDEKLDDCLEQAREAFNYSFYTGSGSVNCFEDQVLVHECPPVGETDIVRFLDGIAVEQLKKHIADIVKKLKGVGFNELINYLIETLFIIVRYLRKNGLPIPGDCKNIESMFNYFRKYDFYPIMEEKVISVVDELLEVIKGENQQEKYVITKIKLSIEKNYFMDLSLEFIAREVNLSYCYLSSLFKAEMGYTFKEYLNMVRVEKAKELLATEGDSLYLISEKVGYSNPFYFGRVFKKYTGLTPMEYKKSILNRKLVH